MVRTPRMTASMMNLSRDLFNGLPSSVVPSRAKSFAPKLQSLSHLPKQTPLVAINLSSSREESLLPCEAECGGCLKLQYLARCRHCCLLKLECLHFLSSELGWIIGIDVTRSISGGGHLFFVDLRMSLICAWGRLEHRVFRLAFVDLFPPQHRQSGKHQDIAEHLGRCRQSTSAFSGEALL